MKRLCLVVFSIAICVFIFSGCEKIFPTSKPISPPAAQMPIQGPLLAQVNQWRIGLDDFERRLKVLEPIAQQQNFDINDYDFKRRALNELVRTALLAEEAVIRGLDKDNDVVEALATYTQTLLAQKLISEILQGVDVADVEIENFYTQYKDQFKKPIQVKVREISVSTQPEAQTLYIKLLQGDSFSSIASVYSESASKERGGDLGYITYDPSKKFKKFWEVVFTLDTDEMSNIFKSEDGKYYIVKVEDKKESIETPLAEVREDIKRALMVEKENKAIENIVNGAKQNTTVTINEDLLLK